MKLFLASLICVMFLLTACTTPTKSSETLATFFPIHEVVKNIAGEQIPIAVAIPIDQDPISYKLSSQDIQKIQQARTIFTFNLPWEDKVLQHANKNATIVVLNRNNHTYPWMSPRTFLHATPTIQKQLIATYPYRQESINNNSQNIILVLNHYDNTLYKLFNACEHTILASSQQETQVYKIDFNVELSNTQNEAQILTMESYIQEKNYIQQLDYNIEQLQQRISCS